MTKRLIFLGPPGAGKGTQAQKLAKMLGVPHISTGAILREATKAGTPLGKKAQNYMNRGELVPDALMLDLIRERLQQTDVQKGWILDGFPRNVQQATFLEALLAELNQSPDCVLDLDVPDEVIVTRLLARGRKDDNEETIRRRLEVYREQTAPVSNFYRDRACLQLVDGNQLPEAVALALQQIVGQSHE
ncbi:adenylate kinase [Lusitaniella coriacea LEGE 07157]|uniref:Adenylate kinase n=1 Tax=Lusitaniella coriacea LEGE 07157 TaxID=945747 RepID=A0A8J7J9T2_9CYAN|nr:adenylate kinase [Lusitaniella coriacea]MBE9115800.1 adenylate kinase [Lusitaniella coriacea LEGE 07157]